MSLSITTKNYMRDKRAWTLVELVMVIVLVAILAGIGVVKFNEVIESSRVSKAVAEVNAIKKALLAFYGDLGAFPPDVGTDTDPGLAYNKGSWSNWNGPYIDKWPDKTPWGGSYDYEYWNCSWADKDGTAGNEVLISVRGGSGYGGNMTTEDATNIDRLLDDGNLNTGNARGNANVITIYIAEGPKL